MIMHLGERSMVRLGILLVGLLLTFGCSRRPDFQEARWTSVRVKYCVGTNRVVKGKILLIEDRETLDELQRLLQANYFKSLWGGGSMKTNQILLTMENGQRWRMYVLTDGFITMQDPDRPKRSFHFYHKGEFEKSLRKLIETRTGQKPVFTYPHGVRVEWEDGA